MDWERISGDWAQWKPRVQERWSRLTDDHLDVIAGRRDHLLRRIEEIYGLSREETERQLRNWERSHDDGEFDERDLVLDDDAAAGGMNGRG
jgi:uncharacterized protein YjbJ (UPF0337 family)